MAMPSGKVAVVTGANRDPGIGFEIVRGLASRLPAGSQVILTSRQQAMGEQAASSLSSEGFNVVFYQLDIADSNSINAFRNFVAQKYGGLDVLVNNAGLAFPLESTTPFPEQARQTIDVNYYGTKKMMQAFLPLLRPGGRMLGVSSTAGQLGSSWSEELRRRLLSGDLTLKEMDDIAEEFVEAAKEGKHKECGFPGTAYGTSKALMTQLHRVLAKEIECPPGLVTALCPGLCRTHMATGRGTFMSNVLWVASFFVGSSAAGGADTPLWLCFDVPDDELCRYHGQFVRNRNVMSS